MVGLGVAKSIKLVLKIQNTIISSTIFLEEFSVENCVLPQMDQQENERFKIHTGNQSQVDYPQVLWSDFTGDQSPV